MALVVVCGTTPALAGEPKKTSSSSAVSPRATTSTATAEPTYFDLAVPAAGGGLTIYRFQRATQRLTLLTRLSAAEVSSRAATFSGVERPGEAIIVLSPEGQKKPPPPPPGGGDPYRWRVPEAEYRAAMQQLQALERNVSQVSIGQLSAASASSTK